MDPAHRPGGRGDKEGRPPVGVLFPLRGAGGDVLAVAGPSQAMAPMVCPVVAARTPGPPEIRPRSEELRP